MDAVEELAGVTTHACRVCGKGFQCGRSLGGHMRSHISLGEAAAAEINADDELGLGRVAVYGGRSFNGVVSYGPAYGLRENPKKTRRLSDFVDEAEDGGGDGDGEHKEFPEHVDEEFVAEEEVAEKIAPPPPAAAAVTVLTAPPRRRRRSMRVAAPAVSGATGLEKEVEDVAFCLLKLSRDTGLRGSPVKEEPPEPPEVKKTSRQPYLYDSDDDDSALLQYGDDDVKNDGGGKSKRLRASYYTPDSISRKKKQCEAVTTKRGRYECPGCGKVFSSYQALGGHRASHKRINVSCSAPKVAAVTPPEPEPSAETYTSLSTLSPSDSPESVTIKTRSRNSEAVAAEKFGCPATAGGSDGDGELYGSGGGHVDQEGEEEEHPVAVVGFLDLNFPPAASEEA